MHETIDEQGAKPMSQMHADQSGLNDISQGVIGAGCAVVNAMAGGFYEQVDENASARESRKPGFAVNQ